MPKQAQLPPRCPFQKKPNCPLNHESISPPSRAGPYLQFPEHHESSSQSLILQEQPEWLEDLLSDPDANSRGKLLRRSASDSVTLLDGILDSFWGATPCEEEEDSVDYETGTGLESACSYGPNSPRRKGHVTFSENALVSALSESVSQDPQHYVDSIPSFPGITSSNSKGDSCVLSGEPSAETKMAKRHSGQRSRVRKLQYIAELERSVNSLQAVVSDLAARVDSVLQQRVALSLENSKLKQQASRMQLQILITKDQYQLLKKEAEKLNLGLARSPNNKFRTYLGSNAAAEAAGSEFTWQMLDMAKLNL